MRGYNKALENYKYMDTPELSKAPKPNTATDEAFSRLISAAFAQFLDYDE